MTGTYPTQGDDLFTTKVACKVDPAVMGRRYRFTLTLADTGPIGPQRPLVLYTYVGDPDDMNRSEFYR